MNKNKMSNILEFKNIGGIDEVGRGPLAGPVVAATVILPHDFNDKRIKDSKSIKKQDKREEVAKLIMKNAISYGIGLASVKEIEIHGILNATFIAMQRSIDNCQIKPDFIYVDGNQFIGYKDIKYECVIKGDSKIKSISAASILAKVYRDNLMSDLHCDYPYYKWDKNMGYGTKDHIDAIKKYGITPHHRKLFCSNFI